MDPPGSYSSRSGNSASLAADDAWLAVHDRAAHEKSSVATTINPHLIEQCENLLESYLMQVRQRRAWLPMLCSLPFTIFPM